MLDFMRDRGDSGRRQEAIDAYLDNTLTPAERARFEGQMAADPRLRAEVEQLRVLRLQLRAMPRRRVPRSFALNPAAYSRPKAQPLLQLYPALRGATALSAFLLIFVLALGLFQGQFGVGAPDASQVAEVMSDEAAPAFVEEEAVEEAAQLAIPEEAANAATEAPAAESELADFPTTEASAEFAIPAPAGTVTTTAPADLSLESPEIAAATLPPNAGGAVEQFATEPAAPVAETMEAIVEDTAGAEEPTARQDTPTPAETTRSLLPFQIGLGALFLLLLVLWLLARRRVRSL